MPKSKLIYRMIPANFWMILIDFSEVCFSLIACAVKSYQEQCVNFSLVHC